MSHSIEVQIRYRHAYGIYVEMNVWEQMLQHCSDRYSERRLFIIIDEKVRRLHGEHVEQQCRRYFKNIQLFEVPEGEPSKSVDQWRRLQDALLQAGVERTTPLLAVGGGVTGDLAGFVAATTLRGIPLIHMPTSLLAMVDSSMGGKTGVNHATGKNLIGSFYQPEAVFADLAFLDTLDRREWISGLSEMLKYAAIRTPAMFQELEQAVNEGFAPSERWKKLIRQSASIKCDIVQEDTLETGKRAYLNFGHTFGHALEKLAGFGNITHGEAVYVGMLAAAAYSRQVGAPIGNIRFTPFQTLYRPSLPAAERIPDLIEAMRHDKKVKDGVIRLVLLKRWGEPALERCTDESLLKGAWQEAFDIINKST